MPTKFKQCFKQMLKTRKEYRLIIITRISTYFLLENIQKFKMIKMNLMGWLEISRLHCLYVQHTMYQAALPVVQGQGTVLYCINIYCSMDVH